MDHAERELLQVLHPPPDRPPWVTHRDPAGDGLVVGDHSELRQQQKLLKFLQRIRHGQDLPLAGVVVLLLRLTFLPLGSDEHLYPIRPCMGSLHLMEYAAHCSLTEVNVYHELATQRVPG